MVGPAFKSGKFHQVVFDKNPFLTDKDGKTYKENTKSKSEADLTAKKFKPSSAPKTVMLLLAYKARNFIQNT
jgi:hypothetical protein